MEFRAGMRLIGRYRGKSHYCDVVLDDDGEIVFILEDGRKFGSPSGAAMGLKSSLPNPPAKPHTNGNQFWSVFGIRDIWEHPSEGGEQAEVRDAPINQSVRVTLRQGTYLRLQKYGTPFEDTPDDVIARLLDEIERSSDTRSGDVA